MALKNWGNADYDYDELAAAYDEDLAGDASFWKPKQGENEIRLLPPPGLNKPYVVRAQHWLRRGNQRLVFNCPAVEDENAKCFLCGKVAALKNGGKDDKALAGEIAAKTQWLYIILDMERPQKGPQVYSAAKSVAKDFRTYATDKKDYGPVIFNIKKGYNAVVTREGTGKEDTEYSVRMRINPEDVTEFVEKADPPDIVALCEPADNDAMEEGWNTIFGDAEEEAPRSRRRAEPEDDEPKSRRQTDDDEPRARRSRDDDDEPRRSRDDEPEDKPARPGRRLRSND